MRPHLITEEKHDESTPPAVFVIGMDATMNAVGRVLIQGGGVGGLTLAAALGQRGVKVDVVEAVGPDAVLGVGLNQPANALAALEEIDVRQDCLDVGFAFEEVHLWNADSVQIAAVPVVEGRYARPSNNAIGRPAYNAILKQAAASAGAQIHSGMTIWDMEEHNDGVEVELATWTGKRTAARRSATPARQRYDLVVGFDGVRSQVRQHLFGDTYTPTFTGFANWRVTLPRLPEIDRIIMAMSKDAKAVLTPISTDEMYIALVTPEPGNPRHERADFARLTRERMQHFSGKIGDLRDSITDDHSINYTPLEYLAVREPWFRGRIAIAGDAAHASPPHLAQGAAMAVEDAVTLASSLEEHSSVDDALAAWFERRRDRALFVADFSLALLKQESGQELTTEENELLTIGLPGALARLQKEAY